MKNTVMVLGCGRLGASIANYASSSGDNVIVIDNVKQSFSRLDESFSGITIIADVNDISELEEAGIKDVSDVVIATGDDNTNLFLTHVCSKIYQVPYVYVRFEDPDKGLLIQGLPVKAIYPFQLTIDRYNTLKAGENRQ